MTLPPTATRAHRPARPLRVAFEHQHIRGEDAAVAPPGVELRAVLVEAPVGLGWPRAGLS